MKKLFRQYKKTDAHVKLTFSGGHVVCYVTIKENKSPGYEGGVHGSILSAVCFEKLVVLQFIPPEFGSSPNKHNFPTLRIYSSAVFATLSLNPVMHSSVNFSLY